MRRSVLLLGLVVAACVASEHWGEKEEDDVVVLTDKTFDDFIGRHEKVFVKFYAPWCGHCKSMAPAYSALARSMKKSADGIPIAKVDGTTETELNQRFGIRGFPALKLFSNGQPIDYKGGREEKDMKQWIENRSNPKATLLSNVSELDKLETLKLAVLYVLPEGDASAKAKFEAVASTFEKVPFLYTHDESVKEKYETNEKYVLVIYRNFDDGKKFLMNNEELSTDTIKTFFNSLRYPLVMDFDQEAAERVFENQLPTLIYFTENKMVPAAKDLKTVAANNQGTLVFTISGITKDFGKKLSDFIGIGPEDDGAVRVIEFTGGHLYKYKCEGQDQEAFEACVQAFKDKKLERIYKSEEIPATNDEPVRVIVGKTFQKEVIESNDHVLLEAYAPWCGHCKALAPIYEQLAEKLKNVKGLVIAKMDGSANEDENFEVQGFPSIRLFKNGEKDKPVEFSGERTLDGFLGFLAKETGLNLDSGVDGISADL